MHEILSRGKIINEDKWVQGYYVCLNGKIHRIYTGYAENDIGSYYPEFYTVIPETVGRCTYLTDKNGVKIFEGDIVTDVNCEYNKYVVRFSNERCGFFPFAKGDGCGCCEINTLAIEFAEIIGNIHDNPELLNVERNCENGS